jgi:hypothetical protein
VPEVRLATTTWRSVDLLAQLVGGYCWVEQRIFEAAGAWATDDGGGSLEPPARVWCAGVSRRHGEWAAHWAERLPVRAGVDRAALVVPPTGPLAAAVGQLAEAVDGRSAVTALLRSVLPQLEAAYDAHRVAPNPVSEATVLEVLEGARSDVAAEIRSGAALL